MMGEHINNDCGHKHDHEHKHHEDCFSFIEITTHESSVVGSVQFDLAETFGSAEALIEDKLKMICGEVIKNGGIIGHIKAFVDSCGSSCMLSIIEDVIDKKYVSPKLVSVKAAAIVFGITPRQLFDIMSRAFADVMKRLAAIESE